MYALRIELKKGDKFHIAVSDIVDAISIVRMALYIAPKKISYAVLINPFSTSVYKYNRVIYDGNTCLDFDDIEIDENEYELRKSMFAGLDDGKI